MSAWLHVIGIGEDGIKSLSPCVQDILENAEIIIGGKRHHKISDSLTAKRLSWPSPFDALIKEIISFKGRKIVILVTGDPLWFSIGARLNRVFKNDEITFHPQLSAFQLMAVRMGWSLADTETLTAHGRPVEQLLSFFQPYQKMIVLTSGSETPNEVAKLLIERGFEKSEMTVFANMDGEKEERFDAIASEWKHNVPDFNTLAVKFICGPNSKISSKSSVLDDSEFINDGNITKKEVRAITISKLMPMRRALLWDIGLGCGSVSIEWMRSSYDCKAIGIEPKKERREMALKNANTLGAPRLEILDGSAPEALENLPRPDAIFIGGGFSLQTFEICWQKLKPFGRIVINAITLETEGELLRLKALYGGELSKISIQKTESIGTRKGWRPYMPVTQWSIIKNDG